MPSTKPPSFTLPASWSSHLAAELDKPYFQSLCSFLAQCRQQGKTIYPPAPLIFNAFEHCGFEQVKAVILGQDPYHGPGQAHGLSFSVPQGMPVPPSLKNIYKELQQDLSVPVVAHGCLDSWAEQGVLLLNSVLTVEQGLPGSHQNRGWQDFTDKVISTLSDQRSGLVFFLWGAYAHKKSALIDESKHLILRAAHPSPLSAYRGFLGCGHFSQANNYMLAQGVEPVSWQLAEQQATLGF
ncbi:uracil-DNA glycosylase [Dasania sp. GY-MA-18]|uniref:Uracil-DNA glycosylase n=1 Tax=Dasania phycosphaerae TaxID=2950436 RepID=A0A9J6RN02_9GAMM|nr:MULTISPECIES: uracil-DNA glycosylase [Dasania]MCR8923298.1 uracil-DNA glycosylase [Dasania sp. GY-MA-18]MCZ0865730.1 uracil-DNA glycosylase [Dasania phycosphaerae]MCZ0869455.1 uracil-DNA glycosylase [Dasania phycosphaerae]